MQPLRPFAARVAEFAQQERLFRRVSRLLVAVSGGADSLAVLVLLRELAPEFGYEIVVCHFDHQLRPESRSELEHVRSICDDLGVPCFTGEGDVRAMAEDTGAGIEETARRMRYQFLAFVAGKERCEAIATGHTADDQVETVLHHIVRGTGIRGLRGMLPKAPVPEAPAQQLVRPLLTLRRQETETICRIAGLTPVVDTSNDDPAFLRNRIRGQVLPALAEVNPAIDRALLGLASSAREAFEPIERSAMSTQPESRSELGAIFSLKAMKALPTEALSLVIEREAAAAQLSHDVNRTRLENLRQAMKAGSGEVRFGEAVAEVSSGRLRVGPPPPGEAPPLEPVMLNVPGVTRAGDWRVEVSTEPLEPKADGQVVAVQGVHGALRVRSMREGDRIAMGRRRPKLARLLVDRKVPRWERRNLVVIAGSEDVLAVPGLDLGNRGEPDESTLWVRLTRIA